MRLPIPAALPAIAIALIALAGCGGNGSGTGDDPPDDFAITVEHSDGSIAPPAHVQWRLAVDETGQGILEYAPDYPGDGVPTFTAQFDVDPGAVDDLYAALTEQDLLRDLDPAPDPPIGGATESAIVTADGRTVEIPAFTDGAAPLAPLERQIHRLAPRQVWDDFSKRREAYAAERYGAAS
jgi:hypothetical protein